MATVVKRKQLKCPQCPRVFSRSGHFNLHMRTHTGEKPHKCTHPGCNSAFARADNLRRHMASHRPTTTPLSLQIPPTTSNQSPSPSSDSSSDTDDDATTDIEHTERPFACRRDGCTLAFHTKENCEKHEKLHDRPTPFRCNLCPAAFAKRRKLGEHHATNHNGRLPYQCQHANCTAAFPRPSSLRKHDIDVHTEKSYICIDEKCISLPPFQTFSALQRHLRRDHPVVASFKCKVCSKRLKTPSGFRKHMETHTNCIVDRLHFKCSFPNCNAAYTSSSNLGIHVRSKHTEKDAFVCETCMKTFSLKSSLKRHMYSKHSPNARTTPQDTSNGATPHGIEKPPANCAADDSATEKRLTGSTADNNGKRLREDDDTHSDEVDDDIDANQNGSEGTTATPSPAPSPSPSPPMSAVDQSPPQKRLRVDTQPVDMNQLAKE